MLTFNSHVDGYHDVSDQLIHDLRRRAEAHFRRQEAERAAITSIAAFEERRQRIRHQFLQAIGGLPTECTPLEPQVTGRIDRGPFTIEKLIYQSVPEFYVTALLYLPKEREPRAPALLFVCGHAEQAKAYPEYQKVCVDFAENGFVVLAMDPPGQGERYQYWDAEQSRRVIGGCTTEHTIAGLQYVLQGASLARQFIWDGMRAVDYLSQRADVDPHRIAVTGNSGGGTQTSFLMVADHRFAAAIPCTFVMTLESYLKTGQPQDSEQLVRGAIAHGPDHDDNLTSMAPKPVLVGAVDYDFFPIEGSIEAVARARRVYSLYGAEEKIAIVRAPARHAYVPALREAAVNWLRRHFQGRAPDFKTGEPAVLPPGELNCTPSGQVLGWKRESKTVFDLSRARLATLPEPRRDPAALRQAVRQVLAVPEDRSATIYPRVIHESVVDGYPAEKVFFFSEPDIVVTGVFVKPPDGIPVRGTELLLFERGTAEIPDRRADLEARLKNGSQLFIFDPRGIGGVESRPVNRSGNPHAHEYRLACDAMMLGVSTLGLRVFDTLRAWDYLRMRADVQPDTLGLAGVGLGGLIALYAAALEPGFASLRVESALASYRDWAETRYYDTSVCNMHSMVWGALTRFDLPDLLLAVAPRPVVLAGLRAATGDPLPPAEYEQRFLTSVLRHAPAGWRPELR